MEKYELTDQIEEPQLITGVSSEISHADGKITPKQAYFLNKMFFDNADNIPFYKIVGSWQNKVDAIIGPESNIKLWLGRQYGEVIICPIYNEKSKKLETSSKKNALSNIKQYLHLNDFLANKYLNLNESGWLDKFKKQSLTEHWYWRADIDLRNYKKILEEAGL